MRAIVNAVLSYGLVNVPVGVCTAAKRQEPTFKTLHVDCGTPVKQRYHCGNCDLPVEAPERVKGFEVAKGTFVHVPEEQLEKLASERSKVIAIRKFIPLNQVDELAVEKSYYLAPNDKLAVSYILLADAMVKHGVVGFGYQSLWGKETPALIWPAENGPLILSPMFCYDEVAQSEEIVSVMSSVGAQIPDEAHNLASDYVALNVSDFNPQEDLVSSSRNRIEEFLSSLVSGIDFEAIEPEPAPEPTFDIVDQLRASIAQTRQPA